jgi:hypothetical protein
MSYNNQTYVDVITFEDKSDTYVSEMLTIGGTVFKNGQGGSAVYVIVRSNGKEVDAFPDGCIIGTSEPTSPIAGMYWWKVEPGSATFMKYDGTEWLETSDDLQELEYVWTLMDKNGNIASFNKTGKVIYLSCTEISEIGTLQCDVRRKGDISYNNGNVYMNSSSGLSVLNDVDGNVELSSNKTYGVSDDGLGNVTLT